MEEDLRETPTPRPVIVTLVREAEDPLRMQGRRRRRLILVGLGR